MTHEEEHARLDARYVSWQAGRLGSMARRDSFKAYWNCLVDHVKGHHRAEIPINVFSTVEEVTELHDKHHEETA